MALLRIYQFLVLCLLGVWCASAVLDAEECPMPNTGKTGSKNSVVLSLYRCSQASSSKKPVCLSKPSSQRILKRGEVIDLRHDVNGYAVTAKFFGDEVCVAYRKVSRIRSYLNGYTNTNECSSECFTDVETETYDTDLVCGYISCGGGWKKFKFVVSESASGSTVITVMSFVVLAICAVLSFGFAW
jgi:hypothetical protein